MISIVHYNTGAVVTKFMSRRRIKLKDLYVATLIGIGQSTLSLVAIYHSRGIATFRIVQGFC